MSYIRENTSIKIVNALKIIVTIYKEECLGITEHLTEYFDNGDILLRYSKNVDNDKIKNIFVKISNLCSCEYDGAAEHILEYINDDDCDYIANYLSIPPVNYDSGWTSIELDNWEVK